MPTQILVKMNQTIIIILIFCNLNEVFTKTEPQVIITPSSPKAAFEYKGKLVPDHLSYGNIRVHINTTDLFRGAGELCKAAEMLQKEQDALQDYVSRREKKNRPTLAIKMVHDITKNLHLKC